MLKNIIKTILLSFVLLCTALPVIAADMTTDVVVVGAGTSGTAAALAALEKGARVILIEKAPFAAGAGTFSGGMFAADSPEQIKTGKTVDKEWLFNVFMESSSYRANARLVKNYINNAGRTVKFLMDNGAEFALSDAGQDGQIWHQDMPATHHGYQNGGGAVNIGKLQKTFQKKGGILLFETKGISIVKDKNGKIAGIIAENADEEEFQINAKAVILATGGAGANAEMLKEIYNSDNPPLGFIGTAQGEGIKMAWEAGARKGDIIGEFFAVNLIPDAMRSLEFRPFADVPFLKVNTHGKRFMREDHGLGYALYGNAVFEQPNHTAWVVFDQTSMDKFKKGGLQALVDQYSKWKNSDKEFYEFNEKMAAADSAKQAATPIDYTPLLKSVEGRDAMIAKSLKELAKKMDIDPETFQAEVARYNELAKIGDVDFHNEPQFMYPLIKAPYYAIRFAARSLGTLGGVVVNENLQAVDKNYDPIPGLYTVGNDATGVWGNSYVEICGASLGFAFTSGMLAGEDAASFVK
ncbi:MAG TPA: hypothetical protein DCM31_09230 [Deferribacteraceae bacterium]|nr:hypothetical protein [Deferribacteraceae bacterium]